MRNNEQFRRTNISAAIRRAWHLTPAEARSVTALALGRNPREIAVVHAVSVHTVRTQLKRAMSKAGVHTQSALVASVYSVVS
jgi:DNA-binding CsgD family transcriptional regulator